MKELIGPVVAAALAVGLGLLARSLGMRFHLLDVPDRTLKPHAEAVPYTGGIALALAVGGGLLVARMPVPWIVSAACVAALTVGFIDDARGVSPAIRLGLQTAIGGLFAAAGLWPSVLPVPIGAIAAIVIVVIATNGANLIDGMDGLAAGCAALTAFGLAVIAARGGGPESLALVTAAALLGILVLNAPPASLFLGDNGAYFTGALLAAIMLALATTYPKLLGALSCFGLMWLDVILAVIRRVVRRVPVTAGDRAHFYDQLLDRGLSVQRTLVVCFLLQGAFVASGIAMASLFSRSAGALFVAVWGIAVIALFPGRFVSSRPSRP